MVRNKLLTLAFVKDCSRILLGYKKRGVGMGLWNGFGGKVQIGETIESAAKRELFEESGLTAESMSQRGVIMFEFDGDPQLWEVHVFSVDSYGGTPTESDEMRPAWYALDNIPYDNMWADDRFWYPYLLSNKSFYGYVKFKDMVEMLDYEFREVKTIDEIDIPTAPMTLSKEKCL